jgi:hypothetical protein
MIGRPQGWRWRAPAFGGYGLETPPVTSLLALQALGREPSGETALVQLSA